MPAKQWYQQSHIDYNDMVTARASKTTLPSGTLINTAVLSTGKMLHLIGLLVSLLLACVNISLINANEPNPTDRRVCQLISHRDNVDSILNSDAFDSDWCTYLVIESASVDLEGKIFFANEHLFPKLQKYKEATPVLKLLLTLEIADEVFAVLSTKASKMQVLADNIFHLIQKNKLHGVNIKLTKVNQFNGYSLNFLEQLSELFSHQPIASRPIFTLDLPRDVTSFDDSVDFSALNFPVNFIILRTYDYCHDNSLIGHTQFNAPLHSGTIISTNSLDDAVEFALNRNIRPENIVVSIPAHGIEYKLLLSWIHFVGAPICEAAKDLTRSEVCRALNDPGVRKDFDEKCSQPFLHRGGSWMTYEDEKSIALKLAYVAENHLGGVLIHSMNSDNLDGTCDNEPFSVHRSISKIMSGKKND